MSTVSPAVTSPLRSREGSVGDSNFSWHQGTDFDPRLSPYARAPHSPHQTAAPSPYYTRGHGDYWPQEAPGSAYWGPPPPYDGGSGNGYVERSMPPRYARARHPRQPYDDHEGGPLRRVPSSPRNAYPRGPAQPNRNEEMRQPSTPRSNNSANGEKKKGDGLSILANVSADLGGKDGKKAPQQQRKAPGPAPTSPLQRRSRPSPITPSQTPQDRHRPPRHPVTPVAGNRLQELAYSWDQPPDVTYPDHRPNAYAAAKRRGYPPHYNEVAAPGYHEMGAPIVVEHGGSFDSQGDTSHYRDYQYPPPPAPLYYDEHHVPFRGYWENGHHSHQPFIAPKWNYGSSPEPYHPPYGYEGHEEAYPPRRPPRHSQHHASPYTYVQQPRLEEKTILRKKFSWKHYPELERFLIENRDEYLKHSNMNYTAEQKQYNNWLTERLLEVAEQNHYVFDPEEFNFVAIRDRIRCYYKSYVQTARKRGLKLPEKKKD